MSSQPPANVSTANLLDGKKTAAELRQEIALKVQERLARGARRPKLVAVLVGDDPASAAYVSSKAKGCQEVGLEGETLRLPATTSEAELLELIARLNGDSQVDGILVQLPLPRQIDESRVLATIDPDKDVDGFHAVNVGRLWQGENALTPATPTGVIELLKRYRIPLAGRHAVVVGRSNIVGKPMAALLLREHCTVSICHSRTRNLAAFTRSAEIVVAALGRPGALGDEHIGDGAVVIDVGINRIDDPALVARLCGDDPERQKGFAKKGYTLVGDVDFRAVAERCAWITPVPGGVGPLTVAMVIANTLKAAELRDERGRR